MGTNNIFLFRFKALLSDIKVEPQIGTLLQFDDFEFEYLFPMGFWMIGRKLVYKITNVSSQETCEVDAFALADEPIKVFYVSPCMTQIRIPAECEEITIVSCKNLTSISVDPGNKVFGYDAANKVVVNNVLKEVIVGIPPFTIPDYVNSIIESFMSHNEKVTSVVIPEGVTSIGSHFLEGCKNLTSVHIPKSVTSIGEYLTFHGCERLTSITVDAENKVYDSRENCNAIIETASNRLVFGCKGSVIPNTVTSIGDSAFELCTIESLRIPESVETLGRDAFCGCSNLKTSISQGIKTINTYCFISCHGLERVDIPSSVDFIGRCAFTDCRNLHTVTFASDKIKVASDAFSNCAKLTTIVVPRGSKYKFRRMLDEECRAKIIEK